MMLHQPKFDAKPTPLNKYILPMLMGPCITYAGALRPQLDPINNLRQTLETLDIPSMVLCSNKFVYTK